MVQRRAKDLEEKEEARRHKKTQPTCERRKEAAVPEDSQARTAETVLGLQQSYGNRYVQRVMGQSPPIDHGAMNQPGSSLPGKLTSLPTSSKPSVDSSNAGVEQQSQGALTIQRQAESGKPSSTPHPTPNVEEMEDQVRILLEPSSVQNSLLNLPLDLTVPYLPFLPALPSTKESTAPEPKAGSATPRSAPVEPGPPKPKAGTTADVLKAITAVPAVATGLKALQTKATEQVKRDFGRLSAGEKVAAVTTSVLIAGGALGGILSDPESRRFAFNQLNGKVIKVPGITGLGVEFNTKGDNLMLGLHLDVGALLPESWGFGPSAPKPIGAPPAAVQRVMGKVQAKLTVNPPDDVYEKEADRVADAVTRASTSGIQRQPVEEEEEPIQTKMSRIQRQEEEPEEEEEEPIQTKLSESQPSIVSKDLEADINTARGGGQPLPDSIRSSLEPQLGHDFSQVHIHTDVQANELSQQLGARAFTAGNDVFFREGTYQPGSDSGRGLIAHELTHVVQQGAARVSRQAAETEGAAVDPKEKAKSELTKAVSNIAGGALEQEYIKILLRSVQACQMLGLGEDTWQWARDEMARVVVDVLKTKIARLDVESSDPRIIEGLVKAAAEVQELGGEEGAVETAWMNAFDVAMDQLTGAVVMLQVTPTEAAAETVAIKLLNLMLLGGAHTAEAIEASKLLTVWGEESGWAA